MAPPPSLLIDCLGEDPLTLKNGRVQEGAAHLLCEGLHSAGGGGGRGGDWNNTWTGEAGASTFTTHMFGFFILLFGVIVRRHLSSVQEAVMESGRVGFRT